MNLGIVAQIKNINIVVEDFKKIKLEDQKEPK